MFHSNFSRPVSLACVLILCFSGVVLAVTFSYTGAFAGFALYQQTSGNAAIVQFYKTCYEKTSTGVIASRGVECTARAVAYLINALAAISSAGYGVGYIGDGPGAAQESQTSGHAPTRRDPSVPLIEYHSQILSQFNQRMLDFSEGAPTMMATDVVYSYIHPFDGFAVRTNIHGTNSTLHVHTNGTHSTSLFDPDDHLARRAEPLPTDANYFTFNGVDGIKMESNNINSPPVDSTYLQDLAEFSDLFANQQSNGVIVFQQSDSWTYQVCSSNNARTVFFYGKIVAESRPGGLGYEPLEPPGCFN